MGKSPALLALLCFLIAAFAAAADPWESMSAQEAHDEAMKHARSNRLQDALPLFRHAVARAPNSPAYLNNLGVVFMRLRRYTDALTSFDQALMLDPMQADASDNIAELRRIWPQFPATWRPGAAESGDEAAGTADITAEGGLTVTLNAPVDGCDAAEPCSHTPPEPLPPLTSAMLSADDLSSLSPAEAARDRAIPTRWHTPGRPKFARRNTNQRSLLPRLTLADLDKPENRLFRLGRLPFVLTAGASPFVTAGVSTWDPRSLGSRFPSAIGDYYPVNMAAPDHKPYLTPLPKAAEELFAPSRTGFPSPHPDFPGRYVQWNVRPSEWAQLMADAGGIPAMWREDALWLSTCLGNGAGAGVPDPAATVAPSQAARAAADSDTSRLLDEFTSKLHWRMVLLGTEGAGMFNHFDVLPTASYQVQVLGSKRWHICAPDQRAFLYGVKHGVDAFYPDYSKHPGFRHARCYEDVISAGEAVFYPRNYWHQTENLATPSVAVSSSVIGGDSWRQVAEVLAESCRADPYQWRLSAELCAALRERCVPLWERMYGPLGRAHLARQSPVEGA